jgi:UDP-N-acetylglucosamine 2-epimerase (non-hydrolysing)
MNTPPLQPFATTPSQEPPSKKLRARKLRARKLRVLSIFGTRPEAVKMAPVVKALGQEPGVEAQVCVTAQHRQMLDQVLDLFQIRPDVDLDLMRPDQSLAELTAAVFTHLDPVLEKLKPDWVLVQGDTTTVMAAALLAFYHHIAVGHVEAGLRTYDKYQPFPEEINRRVAGVVADLHFAPTEWSRQNLLREGVPPDQVIVTGNPVIDALHSIARLPSDAYTRGLLERIGLHHDDNGAGAPRLVLVTAHRRENFGRPLEDICSALRRLAETYGEAVRLVYPVHLNPNVQEPVYRLLGQVSNITLLDPLDYLPLVQLMSRASLVLTDSGGLQEEAPGLGVPVLVMRAVTERPEGIQAGTVKLVGTDPQRIFAEARRLLDDPAAHAKMAKAVNPYGDGHAAGRIVGAILERSRTAQGHPQ